MMARAISRHLDHFKAIMEVVSAQCDLARLAFLEIPEAKSGPSGGESHVDNELARPVEENHIILSTATVRS